MTPHPAPRRRYHQERLGRDRRHPGIEVGQQQPRQLKTASYTTCPPVVADQYQPE
jgi:hypothetical protein